jgi:hypothetical protein
MRTKLLETGQVTLTKFVGRCESCAPDKPGPCYQVTGRNGYVAMCSPCLDALSTVAFEDDQKARHSGHRPTIPDASKPETFTVPTVKP